MLDLSKKKPMDIAFVEEAISSALQEEKLKKIRRQAKILMTVGSCAVLGLPANQRNFLTKDKSWKLNPF